MKVINLKNYGVIVFQSNLTVDMFKALKKHMPSALKARDEEGNDVFVLDYKESEKGSISNYGVCFNKVDSEGYVLLTVNETLENKDIAENYAAAILQAKQLEAWASEAYSQLAEQLLDVTESIIDGTPCTCDNVEIEESEEE